MKISVTIPAYKGKFLEEAIISVINQSWQEWELIIVDDCSPEDLASIVKPYLSDRRIRYYRNEKNCGVYDVVDNWNICLGYCTGDYVLCMGDDDRLLPCCMEQCNSVMSKYPDLNVYHTQTQIIDENGNVIEYQEGRPDFETCEEMLSRQWKQKGKQYLGDFLFSRQWLIANGGYVKFPCGLSSDRTTANLAAKEKGIANVQEVMFEYRDFPSTISRTQDLRTAVSSCNLVYKWYQEHFFDMLTSDFHDYYVSRISDIICMDVASRPLKETCHWLTSKEKLFINYTQILKSCLRGMVYSVIH